MSVSGYYNLAHHSIRGSSDISSSSTSIEIFKESLHFSAAHFTIFGPHRRENLHGHNFRVRARVETRVGRDGLSFDYNILKTKLQNLCDELDECVLLPSLSPHLRIENQDPYKVVHYADEKIYFLQRDVQLVPMRNITVEELAAWFIQQITSDASFSALPIEQMEISVSSGPSEQAASRWVR